MKRILKRLCVVATALAMSFGLSQCAKDNDAFIETPEGQVYVTLTASKGEMTKAELTDEGTTMTVTWSENDKLYVVGATDGLRGYLTLQSGAGTKKATFAGCINYLTQRQNVRFYYLGKNGSTSNDSFNLSVASQDGTLDGIENTMHIMGGLLSNVSPSTVNFGSVTMNSMIALGKFNLIDCTGYDAGTEVTLSACSSATLNLKTGEWSGQTTGDITLSANITPNYIIALIPGTYSLSFSQTGNYISAPYVASRTIGANKYYTADAEGNPIEVGVFKYIDKNDVFRGFGRIIRGVVWAPVNSEYDENHTYGRLYQWGRKYGQAYNESDAPSLESLSSAFTSHVDATNANAGKFYYNIQNWYGGSNPDQLWNSNEGTSSTVLKSSFDPCPNGWRVPTSTELSLLVNDSASYSELKSYQGMKGHWYNGTSTLDEKYAGTDIYKGVFLPSSGNRGYNGEPINRDGGISFYWSSSIVSSHAQYLIANGDGKIAFIGGGGNRVDGYPVRCIFSNLPVGSIGSMENENGSW